ncbi:MAG: tRNA pseudouridine(13) synthase TruD [Gammaproteobacteria bacterium TMED163]|nr:MAG: tRNA pseudouridine(13) synthase TruD [Gammaproteobacteria bacterium TMED163]
MLSPELSELDQIKFEESFLQLDSLAYATGKPELLARIKQHWDDFRVDEELGFAPTGAGEHLLLRIEKAGQSTTEVARQISSTLGISDSDIGYSGMKDRQARTRQWFSIRLDQAAEAELGRLQSDQLQILEQSRNQRKLQIGAHKANHFQLILREVMGVNASGAEPPATNAEASLDRKLQTLAHQGVPNYFGSQRFGRDLSNLHQVRELLRTEASQAVATRNRYRHKRKRSMLYSAARAYLFNQLLSARITRGNWASYVDGDVLNLNHTKRCFLVEPGAWGPELQQRLDELDIHITGLLPGRIDSKDRYVTRGQSADTEKAVCKEFAELVTGIEQQGLSAARRPLRFQVQQLQWQWLDSTTVSLAFTLPTGAYATSLLREVCLLRENEHSH